MGDESLVSAAALAAYDANGARIFGRPVAEAAEPLPWRTGPVGQLTIEEHDDRAGLTFGRFTGEAERQARHRVAETRRQLALELELVESAKRIGWPAVMYRRDLDRQVIESVRARAEGTTTRTGTPSQSVRESTAFGGGRTELREVTGWKPKPWQPRGR